MPEQQTAIAQMCDVYRTHSEVAFFLGAGVTCDSGVPLYNKLARRVFERAREIGLHASVESLAFAEQNYRVYEPEKLLQFVRSGLGDDDLFFLLVKQALYKNTGISGTTKHNTVIKRTYLENETLNALISFCAVRYDSPLARPGKSRKWRLNRQVQDLMTTNFDYLIEGSYHSKYRTEVLKPVSKTELDLPNHLLVHHFHGYLNYRVSRTDPSRVYKSDTIIISENDYIDAGYELLSYGNRKATSYLNKYHTIFIGCSMQDRNVRRWLYTTKNDPDLRGRARQHFAILPEEEHPGQTQIEDRLLADLGVKTIRLKRFEPEKPQNKKTLGEQVKEILAELYVSLPEVSQADWDTAYHYDNR